VREHVVVVIERRSGPPSRPPLAKRGRRRAAGLRGPNQSCLCLTEVDDEEGIIESKRYDGSIEEAIKEAIEKLGGCSGAVRLLGHAHFFREENHEEFDIETDVVLLSIDGYSVAQYAFGEGELTWIIPRADSERSV
jgi:hypothetical protein